MQTTCMGCGQTTSEDLSYWRRDTEGNFWHAKCRRDFLEQTLGILAQYRRQYFDKLGFRIEHPGPHHRDWCCNPKCQCREK